jgi:hypothetical protein
MSTKCQAKTQVKTPAAPAAARIPQPPVAEAEHEAERPDIAAQLEGAARLGHSLGAVRVDSSAPPIIQRQEFPEEDEEELQLKREPAAIQRQELLEEEEELMMEPEEGRVEPQGGQVPPEVEGAIHRARGGGQPLERALQEQMGASLCHDFSRVRVHTDSEADELNQQLQAKAFTTGADIFFKGGAYDPSTSGGQELIVHELSHVVQQSTGRVRGDGSGMTVRSAGDAFEREADELAQQGPPTESLGRGQKTSAIAKLRSFPTRFAAIQRVTATTPDIKPEFREASWQGAFSSAVDWTGLGGSGTVVQYVERRDSRKPYTEAWWVVKGEAKPKGMRSGRNDTFGAGTITFSDETGLAIVGHARFTKFPYTELGRLGFKPSDPRHPAGGLMVYDGNAMKDYPKKLTQVGPEHIRRLSAKRLPGRNAKWYSVEEGGVGMTFRWLVPAALPSPAEES